jgi:hypothetical protein
MRRCIAGCFPHRSVPRYPWGFLLELRRRRDAALPVRVLLRLGIRRRSWACGLAHLTQHPRPGIVDGS